MLKKKSNKLIAIMLSVLLSGVIPAAVTFGDVLMGDADGEFIINNGGQFDPDSYNDIFTYYHDSDDELFAPLTLAIRDQGGPKDTVEFTVSGIAELTSNPGGATLNKAVWALDDYVENDKEEFTLNIKTPVQPGKYTYVVTFTATNNADGLKSASATATVIVYFAEPTPPTDPDTTKPTLGFVLNPATPDGENGWYTSSVEVTFNYSDEEGGSGIDTSTEPTDYTLSNDGTYPSKIVTVKDKAGNEASVTIPEIKIDETAPTLTHSLDPENPNGNNGWYTSSVSVEFTASDSGSKINPVSKPADLTISEDGITPETKFTVKDMAGNIGETTVPEIKLDTTNPEITINIPEVKAEYKLDEVVNVDWSAIDVTSGIDTANTFADSTVLDTSSVGPMSFTVTATDNAGNTITKTVNYTVIYDFDGFLQPVNMDGLNSAKAGSSIPIKFSLNGDQGLDILLGAPKAYTYHANVADELSVVDTVTAGQSSLSYDPVTDQYTYVWKTDKSWARSAKQLALTLNDGTVHYAYFSFK